MIYKVHPNFYSYATYHLDDEDLMDKLGKSSIFGIELDAVKYAHQWQPIKFTFENALLDGPLMPTPDIMADYGRVFFNEKSYSIFYHILADHGEFLPIYSNDMCAYIFNPLAIAEEFNGLDVKTCTKNEYNYLTSLNFIGENVKALPVFKCEYDNFIGIYCQQKFKDTVEKNNLTGVIFDNDLSLSFPSDEARITSL